MPGKWMIKKIGNTNKATDLKMQVVISRVNKYVDTVNSELG